MGVFGSKGVDNMTLQQMIEKKKELGYSNEMIAEGAGVPLGTVQKIFGGNTKSPRYQTMLALNAFFMNVSKSNDAEVKIKNDFMQNDALSGEQVAEAQAAYNLNKEELRRNFDSVSVEEIATSSRSGDKRIADYLDIPEGVRIEMIDGVFYDMAGPSFVHQKIGSVISASFDRFIDKNGGDCITIVAPFDVQLDCDDKTMVQPDVMIVCDRNKLTNRMLKGAPDLVVEIVSMSNFYMDYQIKLCKYQKAGVREYWIVNPKDKAVLVYYFDEGGKLSIYSFDEKVPVSIWDGKCKVDFAEIFKRISFMYDEE